MSQNKIEKGPPKKKKLKQPATMETDSEFSHTNVAYRSYNTSNEITSKIKINKKATKKKQAKEPKTIKELSDSDTVHDTDRGKYAQIKTEGKVSKTERERKLATAKLAKELSDSKELDDNGDLQPEEPLSTTNKHPEFTDSVHSSEFFGQVVNFSVTEVRKTYYHDLLDGRFPVNFIYEDNQTVAFFEKKNVAPLHFVVMPRRFIKMLSTSKDSDEQLLGHLLVVARTVAEHVGLHKKGYRVVINVGSDGCQLVHYLHLQVLGGRKMYWPPG